MVYNTNIHTACFSDNNPLSSNIQIIYYYKYNYIDSDFHNEPN